MRSTACRASHWLTSCDRGCLPTQLSSAQQHIVVAPPSVAATDIAAHCPHLVRSSSLAVVNFTYAYASYDLGLDFRHFSSDATYVTWAVACAPHELSFEYALEYSNPGGILTAEFDCADQGLLLLYIVISAVYLPVFYVVMMRFQPNEPLDGSDDDDDEHGGGRDDLHSSAQQLITFATGCVAAGVCLNMFHLLLFGWDGAGVPLLQWVALLLDSVGQCLLIATCVLLSHQALWTAGVSRATRPLCATAVALVVAYTAVLVSELFITNEERALVDSYDTPAGVALGVVRVLCALWLVRRSVTAKLSVRWATQRTFYSKLIAAIAAHAVLELAALVLVRAHGVNTASWKVPPSVCHEAATLALLVVPVVLLWPSRFRKLFEESSSGVTVDDDRNPRLLRAADRRDADDDML